MRSLELEAGAATTIIRDLCEGEAMDSFWFCTNIPGVLENQETELGPIDWFVHGWFGPHFANAHTSAEALQQWRGTAATMEVAVKMLKPLLTVGQHTVQQSRQQAAHSLRLDHMRRQSGRKGHKLVVLGYYPHYRR